MHNAGYICAGGAAPLAAAAGAQAASEAGGAPAAAAAAHDGCVISFSAHALTSPLAMTMPVCSLGGLLPCAAEHHQTQHTSRSPVAPVV